MLDLIIDQTMWQMRHLDKHRKDKADFSYHSDYGVYPVIWCHMMQISYLSVVPSAVSMKTRAISCIINYGKIREKYFVTLAPPHLMMTHGWILNHVQSIMFDYHQV
jgi:hypothetical protein